MIDASAFNFDTMKEAVGIDPFAKQDRKFESDNRFYKLKKDKDGNGAALIRFMPDKEKGMIQKMFTINTTITKNGKKRFVSLYSPAIVGLPCPFQEMWQKLWNEDKKSEAKLFSRGTRYVTNIKVLKDPANPENEGKIFLYEMSGSMKDKIQSLVDPSESDRALGAEPKQLFNPFQGNSFRLVAKKGANGIINYDASDAINDVNSIYSTIEEGLEDIKTNCHTLSDMIKPEAFLSYEQLTDKLNWVTWSEQPAPQTQSLQAEVAQVEVAQAEIQPAQVEVAQVEVANETQPEPATQTPEPSKEKSLDDLLDGLV